MKHSLIILTISLGFYSCENSGLSSNEKKVLSLELGDQKIIPVNDKSANFFILSQVHFEKNGNQLFIHINYFDSDPNYLCSFRLKAGLVRLQF